jgi:hypothetical protein
LEPVRLKNSNKCTGLPNLFLKQLITYTYTLAPTKEPKYSCKVAFNFHTELENV